MLALIKIECLSFYTNKSSVAVLNILKCVIVALLMPCTKNTVILRLEYCYNTYEIIENKLSRYPFVFIVAYGDTARKIWM